MTLPHKLLCLSDYVRQQPSTSQKEQDQFDVDDADVLQARLRQAVEVF